MDGARTPSALGYGFPAEWEPHRATWLAWPHNRETWPGRFERIPAVWAELVRTLARFEPVEILAGGPAVMDEARSMVGHLSGVRLHDIPTNDAWIRDYGPSFLRPRALVDWQYNAWGDKYLPYDLDNDVPGRIAARTGCRRFAGTIVLEGGAVDSNGQGTLLAAEHCLLDPRRNPGVSRVEVERQLAAMLGACKVLWLQARIAGDDTDGHVDQYARFVGPSAVVVAVEEDPRDVNHGPLEAARQRLAEMSDQNGRPLEVIPLPMPQPMFWQGQRLPASYTNFYVANGVVVAPQFDDPADRRALEILARLFPKREVIGLPARDLVVGLGAYHCITQQEPAEGTP
ncbi:MAG TPA: agmatine deiminase family protein [Planctomycetaceae bacterium]|nr:agmatine deiminase family protein [Planctomycetaceae bacterium]